MTSDLRIGTPTFSIVNSTLFLDACTRGDVAHVRAHMDSFQLTFEDESGLTALICAAANGHLEIVQVLLLGSHLNHQDVEGATALMCAAEQGRDSVVDVLIRAGADINLADLQGRTALIKAAINGHSGAAGLLIPVSHADHMDKEGKTAQMYARQKGHGAVIAAFVAHEAQQLRAVVQTVVTESPSRSIKARSRL